MRSITIAMPGAVTKAVDDLLARIQREDGAAPNRFDFLAGVFTEAIVAKIRVENGRRDAAARTALVGVNPGSSAEGAQAPASTGSAA